MDPDNDINRDTRLATALERLIHIQKSIMKLNQEALKIRRHLNDYDVNIEAMSILVNMRSKDEKNSGAQVLKDLIEYASQTGTKTATHAGPDASQSSEKEPRAMVVEQYSELGDRAPNKEGASLDVTKLLYQIGAAIVVTLGLFALIH